MPSIAQAVASNQNRIAGLNPEEPPLRLAPKDPVVAPAPAPVAVFPSRGTYPLGMVLPTDFASAVSMRPGGLRAATLLNGNPVFIRTAATSATQQKTAGKPAGQAGNPTGTPLQVLSGTASIEPYDSSHLLVSVTFVPAADPFFGGVNIWMTGYHKNANPVLVATGLSNPVSFVVDVTGEKVAVIVQAVSPSGISANLQSSPRASVTLDGTFPAPPPPTIVQTTTAIGGPGFQFQFTFESGNLAAQVDHYNVYRSQTTNDFSTTRLLTTVAQSSGTETFQDTPVSGKAFYFISAVDVNGNESSIVSCQSGAIAAVSKIDPSSTHVLTKGVLGLNGTGPGFTYTSTTTSITWSWTGLTIFRTDGTLTAIPDGTQAITGLTASTTYFFYPFWNELLGLLQWVTGGTGSPAYAQTAVTNALNQQQTLQHHVALNFGGMSAATTASGGGGGSGGGTGGGGGGDKLF